MIRVWIPAILAVLAFLMMLRYGFDRTRTTLAAVGAIGVFLICGKYLELDAITTGNITMITFTVLYAILLLLVFWKKQKSE